MPEPRYSVKNVHLARAGTRVQGTREPVQQLTWLKAAAEKIDDPAGVETLGCAAALLELAGVKGQVKPPPMSLRRRHQGAEVAPLHELIACFQASQVLTAHRGDG